MANRNEIMQQVDSYKSIGQDIIRRNYLKKLADYTRRPTIIYFSSFPAKIPGISGSLLSIDISDIQGFMTCINELHGEEFDNNSLDLILHSPGGSLEAADQIVQYLRAKYKHIRAIVPQNAMSAATMLACACDEIVLGRESAIGPIDPQITIPGINGIQMTMPAHAILEDFKKAKQDVATNPQLAALWAPKLAAIPNGMLHFCEKTIELAKDKVGEWLDMYMFKNEDEKNGKEIAEWLGNFGIHKTHGRPITYDVAKEKGLRVSRLEDDAVLQDLVLSVYHATLVTFDVTHCVKIIENNFGKGSYSIVQPPVMPQFSVPMGNQLPSQISNPEHENPSG